MDRTLKVFLGLIFFLVILAIITPRLIESGRVSDKAVINLGIFGLVLIAIVGLFAIYMDKTKK